MTVPLGQIKGRIIGKLFLRASACHWLVAHPVHAIGTCRNSKHLEAELELRLLANAPDYETYEL